MTSNQLTPTQHAVLAYATEHTGGKIDWFPDNIKGGARKKVLDGLSNRALITSNGPDWIVAAEGYDALGIPRRGPITLAALDAVIANAEAAKTHTIHNIDPEIEAAAAAIEDKARADTKKPRTRDNSKQAQVIAMLKRPEGATIAQICEVTGWQAHTVRGTIAGIFKKKLGLNVVSKKSHGGERIYRIG